MAALLHTCPAVRTACVTRPPHTHHLLDGWPGTDCPAICTDKITLNSLHYSMDGNHADKFHVFGLLGATSVKSAPVDTTGDAV